jgi:Cft2 family RNA processing exonuclease
MRITNLNPDADIGASAWMTTVDGHNLLLDAGTHPKREGLASLPLYEKVKDLDVDTIALSHCHHDHVGSLPVALQYFPQARVMMTDLSYFIVERILHNSVNVMTRQREELGIREYPLYTHEEIDDRAPVFQGFGYRREIEWAQYARSTPGVRHRGPTLEFFDAGHTLGSAGILVRGRKQSLFYSGDVCFHDQTLLRAADFEGAHADVLILESTRGNRAVKPGFRRENELARLAEGIERVLARKGTVLIPAFALGRTQEMLAFLAGLMRSGRVREQPVYIGGLGRVFTEIYDLQSARTNRSHPTLKLTNALNLQVLSANDLESIPLRGGRIFVLTSGMMSENTGAHALTQRLLEDEKHGIFFVGYADPETPGGKVKAAKHGERFTFSPSAGKLTRKCEVMDFDLTAHANRDDLLGLVGDVDPRVVVLGHGDHDARAWMAKAISERHPRIKIFQPGPGESVEI